MGYLGMGMLECGIPRGLDFGVLGAGSGCGIPKAG